MAVKTPCPVTRKEFAEKAKAVEVVIDGNKLIGAPREFATGSLGWYINGKVTVMIGDKPVTATVGLNLIVVGSKELPKDAPA